MIRTLFRGLALSFSTFLVAATGCGESTGDGGQGGEGGVGGLGEGGTAGADVEPVEGVDFGCGSQTCNSAEAYCSFSEEAPDKEGNTNASYGCVALPDACLLDPTCACLSENFVNFECCDGDVSTGILAQSPHGGCL
jgi:hypothetical protein